MKTKTWVWRAGGMAAALGVLLVFVSAQWTALPLATAEAAEALQAPAKLPSGYGGSEACIECHEDFAATFAESKHGRIFLKHPRTDKERLGCETCHGPGLAHGEAEGEEIAGMRVFRKGSPLPVAEQNAVCLECHEKGTRLFWQGSPHDNREVACTGCHTIMANISDRAQLTKATEVETCKQCHLRQVSQQMYFSHMPIREGKMNCASCHNPHGTATDSLLKANSLNDICYKCHADKRGPYLWEHPPVTESCSNCHTPHGSNHEVMLKLPSFRLCQTCHIESRHPTEPHSLEPPTFLPGKTVAFRGCVSCHYNIHGSNHPSGYRFLR